MDLSVKNYRSQQPGRWWAYETCKAGARNCLSALCCFRYSLYDEIAQEPLLTLLELEDILGKILC